MIRFIDLGTQIGPYDASDPDNDWPRQFAFFDTIYSQFIKVGGEVVFDSLRDLMLHIDLDDDLSEHQAQRIFNLTPDWVRTVPAPTNTTQIWGVNGSQS